MKSVAIDIGSYSIKIADLESNKTGNYQINECLEITTPTDESDRLSFLEQTLKKIAHHYQKQSVRYVLQVNQKYIGTQYCSFPIKEKHKIIKSLPFQLAEDVPFNSNNMVYESKFLASVGNNTELLALIVNKQHVAEILELVRDCGIEPDIITAPSIALSNFISDWSGSIPSSKRPLLTQSNYQSDEQITPSKVIMDIGHKTTNIMIHINGSIVQSNTIFFGGSDIIEDLAKAYQLPNNEATQHLIEKGFVLASEENASENQVFFSNTIKKSVKAGLIKPADQIFLSAKSKTQLSLESIHIAGGVAGLTNLTDYLTKEFNIETYVLHSGKLESKFNNAVAMAIEGFRTPKNPPVNFIKDELSPKSQFFYNLWKAYGHMIRVGAVCVLLLFIHGIVKGHFADKLSNEGYEKLQKLAKSSDFKIKKPSASKINRFVKNKSKEIKSLDELSKLTKSKSAIEILEEISMGIPSKRKIKLDVKKLTIQNNKVNIQGLVDNQNQQQSLLIALRNMSSNKKVVTTQPQFTTNDPTKIAFAYTFSVGNK